MCRQLQQEAKGEKLGERRNQGPVQPVSLLRRDVDKRKGCHGGLGEATTCCGMLMNQDLFGEGNNGSRSRSRPDQRAESRESLRGSLSKIREARRLQA